MAEEIEALQVLGMTGTEARLYAALVRHGPLTGYQAGQRAAVIRASAYPALERLVRRGAVLASSDGRATWYEAVPVAQFADQKVRQMHDAARRLERLLDGSPPPAVACAGKGIGSLMARGMAMVAAARTSLHVALYPPQAERLGAALMAARQTGRTLEIACLARCQQPCCLCGPWVRSLPDRGRNPELLVCRDREEVLVADVSGEQTPYVVMRSAALGEAVANLVEQAAPMTAGGQG